MTGKTRSSRKPSVWFQTNQEFGIENHKLSNRSLCRAVFIFEYHEKILGFREKLLGFHGKIIEFHFTKSEDRFIKPGFHGKRV